MKNRICRDPREAKVRHTAAIDADLDRAGWETAKNALVCR
jgi:hypothetical protein